ncbi:hypothetical protein AAC691_07515 [Nguyenibacter vanlangensis]|uniref:Uncharacterized protein n=1 Tax=Nguyenibacter vanlangensis TaxID=1216886 RepID=A0A7Y7M652_9PROT|nr:hypothetical protein [Nguyenibacter vanlangensis]NVN10316.1 hypothetical protein [Nguyenibacter vanlangensis]
MKTDLHPATRVPRRLDIRSPDRHASVADRKWTLRNRGEGDLPAPTVAIDLTLT